MGAGTTADNSHKIVDIRKPRANPFANLLAAGILWSVRKYSITRKPVIAPYDIAILLDVPARAHVC
jgi:hypothetical protein